MKKTKEELLELKRVRENCKTVIKFKSTFFQILFQGMVENVPGLVVDKIRNNLHTHKYLNINMNFYGIDLSLNVSLEKSYEKIIDVDLMSLVFQGYCDGGICYKCTLSNFIEQLTTNILQTFGKEFQSRKLSIDASYIIFQQMREIHLSENSEQSKRDLNWYFAEFENHKKKLCRARLDFSNKLSELLS